MSHKAPHFNWQRSSRVTDLSLPADASPDAALYNTLRESERRLDWTLARKVMEMQDTMGKNIRRRHKLRIYITHVARNQAWQLKEHEDENLSVDFESGRGIPSWELRVEGKLRPTQQTSESLLTSALPSPPPRKFSTFLKSIIIETDRDHRIFPEESIVEWHQNPSAPAEDGFIVRRRGDISLRVRIILHLDHTPERVNLGPQLSELLGIKQASRMEAVAAMYHYIKRNGLQDKNERRVVRTNDALRQIGIRDNFAFHFVPEIVHKFLLPPDPIVIIHNINLDANESGKTIAYDVDIDMDDVDLKAKMRDVLNRLAPAIDGKITKLDHEIGEAAQSVRSERLKQQFFESFADNPQDFIATWIESQSRDLETILGTERGVPDELMRRSEFYRLPWVEEAAAVHEGMRVVGMLPAYQTAAPR